MSDRAWRDAFPHGGNEREVMYQQELGRRAVALKRWRWLYGMVTLGGLRVSHSCDTYPGGIRDGDARVRPMQVTVASAEVVWSDDLWPDFRDPATLGCLLSLVREAHRDPLLYANPSKLSGADWMRWVAVSGDPDRDRLIVMPDGETAQGDSEAEALVAALEAAEVVCG